MLSALLATVGFLRRERATALVYNRTFAFHVLESLPMIKFLQTPGKAKKIILGGMLLVICAAMVITLVPGGMLGDAFGFGVNTAGVIAKVGPEEVTVQEVETLVKQMGRQQFPQGFPSQFRPFLMQQAAQQLI